jgi:hypothetical protein
MGSGGHPFDDSNERRSGAESIDERKAEIASSFRELKERILTSASNAANVVAAAFFVSARPH